MKLYTLTVTCHVDDLDDLTMHLDAHLEPVDVSLQSVVLTVAPGQLRKVADDLAAQQ